mgnify:FL=1
MWEGDESPMSSKWSHLLYADEEAKAEALQAHSDVHNVAIAKVMLAAKADRIEVMDSTLFYHSLAVIATSGDIDKAQSLEPYRTLAAVATQLMPDDREVITDMKATATVDARERYTSDKYPDKFPKSFLDALTKDDWRKWVEAYRKEWGTWDLTNSYVERSWTEMKGGAILTRLYELADVKKNGIYKIRPVLAGETMEKGLDYGSTFARTANSDMIRFIVAFNVSVMNSPLWASDVSCAFLQAKNDKPVYVYQPSWYDYIYMDWEELARLRMQMLHIGKEHGKSAIRKMTQTRGRVETVLECISAVYGNPAATRLWSLKNDEYLTQKCKLNKSVVEPCLYYMTETGNNPSKKSSTMVTAIMLVGVHVDDMLISGTERLKQEFKREYSKACGESLVKWQIPATEFTSMQIKQDLDRHYCELTQPKYWEIAGKRFEKYLPPKCTSRIPAPAGTELKEATPKEVEEAKDLPYRELVGTLNYPAQMTKFEIQYAVQRLSKHLRKWSRWHFLIAVQVLMYCITTRDIGILYSRGLDKHGVNVLSAYADASFGVDRPIGCRYIMFNGAIIRAKSAQHSVMSDSTCHAEAVEAELAGNDIAVFRFLVGELGFKIEEPTTLYQDNQATIKVAEGHSTSGSSGGAKARHILIRVAKLSEYITDKEIELTYCRTVQMLADLGTKFHNVKVFEFLRDMANGYALVRARNDGYRLPDLVVTL